MNGTRPRITRLPAVLCAAFGFLTASCSDSTPLQVTSVTPPDGISASVTPAALEGGTDHFACYEATDRNPNAPQSITLDDQFDGTLSAEAMTALEFCNPVAKTVGTSTTPIDEPNAHLTFYELTQNLRAVRRKVVVSNQFGVEQTLRVAAPRIVAVPTLKNGEGTTNDLGDLSHFTCYEASGKRLNVSAGLQDQFHTGPETILVHAPQYFCNPAEKTHGSTTTAIARDEDHLVCYKVTPSNAPPSEFSTVTVENQFEGFDLTPDEVFEIGPLHFLCVPSEKLSFSPG